MQTKSVMLTEDEIEYLIQNHGHMLHDMPEEHIERINYLHKRLKAFKEPETVVEKTGDLTNTAQGWGTGNG